jgi:hypothetical protein
MSQIVLAFESDWELHESDWHVCEPERHVCECVSVRLGMFGSQTEHMCHLDWTCASVSLGMC